MYDHYICFLTLKAPISQNRHTHTLKQSVDKLPRNCLSVFDHFVGLALKGFRFDVKQKEPNRSVTLYMNEHK